MKLIGPRRPQGRALVGGVLVAILSGAIPAAAQYPAGGVAPRARPDAPRLVRQSLTYMASLHQGMTVRPVGERVIQVAPTQYGGYNAWEVVETRGAGAAAASDTVIADYLGFQALHWGAYQPMPNGSSGAPAARASVEFRADSMFGVISAPNGRRSIFSGVPAGSYVSAGHFEAALQVLPIGPDFRDSATVLATDLARTLALPAEIVVTGEEKLTTPAGEFDCWQVAVSTTLGRTQYWLSRTDRTVVKTVQTIPETGDVLVYLLTRISR